jgi:hypothetical protein
MPRRRIVVEHCLGRPPAMQRLLPLANAHRATAKRQFSNVDRVHCENRTIRDCKS